MGELALLIGERQPIHIIARSKAALWAQAQPIKIDVAAGLPDPTLDGVDRLELAQLGADDAEHRSLVVWQVAQWLKVARALGVVFQKKAIHVGAEQSFRDRIVPAAGLA